MLFEDLVGQTQPITILRRAIAGSRVPHAYLFEGPSGVGKRSAAIGLALALNCQAAARQVSDPSACGACDSCRRILAGLHPDVLTFAPDGAQILMEQAKEIIALAQRPPHEARARVVVIDEADRLNPSAANCLLKSLEEPAAGTHLVLVTFAPDRLLDTIRSRTQRVRFAPVSTAALLELGARRTFDRAHALTAAVVANGSVARFIELADSDEDRTLDEATMWLRRAAQQPDIGPILDVAAQLGDKESKQRLPDVLALLARVYRDALVTVAGAPDLATPARSASRPAGAGVPSTSAGAAAPQPQPQSQPQSIDLPPLAIGRALGAIVEADADLAANVNATMVIERLLLRLRREEHVSP